MVLTVFMEHFKELVSRGIVLEGFGLLELYVPKKSVKIVNEFIINNLPEALGIELYALNRPMKKGIYELGRLSEGTLITIHKKYKLEDKWTS